jgi:hypothetical protein
VANFHFDFKLVELSRRRVHEVVTRSTDGFSVCNSKLLAVVTSVTIDSVLETQDMATVWCPMGSRHNVTLTRYATLVM